MIKAQVYVGGRGKAGGIQFGETPEQARAAAVRVLGMEIKGLTVAKVLVTSKVDIREEYSKYLKALRELIGSYAFPKMRAATKTSAPPPTT